jgi:HTH-type transcriptional regulator/antitoxin HigA
MGTTLDLGAVRALRTEEEYDRALAEVEGLMGRNPAAGSEDAARLEGLSVLVEHYERERYPMGGTSTPQSVVLFMLDQRGMNRRDLEPLLGGKGRVSEFFSGKRPLSLGQIKTLRRELGIPAELLIDFDADEESTPVAREILPPAPLRTSYGGGELPPAVAGQPFVSRHGVSFAGGGDRPVRKSASVVSGAAASGRFVSRKAVAKKKATKSLAARVLRSKKTVRSTPSSSRSKRGKKR